MKVLSNRRLVRNTLLGLLFGAGFGLVIGYVSTNFALGMVFGAFTAMNVVVALRRKGSTPDESSPTASAIHPVDVSADTSQSQRS